MPAPQWSPGNLSRHHQKRLACDQTCMEDLVGGQPFTEEAYRVLSEEAVEDSWAEVETDMGTGPAAYFADDRILLAIVSQNRLRFITCYHRCLPRDHGMGDAPPRDLGDRRIEFKKWVRYRTLRMNAAPRWKRGG